MSDNCNAPPIGSPSVTSAISGGKCFEKAPKITRTFQSFEAMGSTECLLRGIYAYGYETPSVIQQKVLLSVDFFVSKNSKYLYQISYTEVLILF